ncbi:MAG: hypothetical protein U0694_09645 [Anaerolineae bacterium]
MKNMLIILTCLLFTPFPAAAQNESLQEWTLSQVVSSEQLGVEFNAPEDWVVFKDEVHFAVYVAQNAADFRAIIDDDALTLPANPFISLNALLTDTQTQAMPLQDIAAISTSALGLETVSTSEISVLARPALAVVFTDETTHWTGTMALWRQGDIVFNFGLHSIGSVEDEILASSWELLLSGLRPVDALQLSETAEVPFLGYSINYPEGWSIRVDQRSSFNSLSITEFAEDRAGEGYRLIIWTTRFPDGAEETLSQTVTRLADIFNVINHDSIPIDQFMVLGRPGVGMGWSSRTGETTYGILVPHTPFPELETYYIITAASQSRLNDFWTTWIAMLQSVRLLE